VPPTNGQSPNIDSGPVIPAVAKIAIAIFLSAVLSWNVYLGTEIINIGKWRASTESSRYTIADAKEDSEKSSEAYVRLIDAIRGLERSMDSKADKTSVNANTITLTTIAADIGYIRKTVEHLERDKG
jgi:hypothetical protein